MGLCGLLRTALGTSGNSVIGIIVLWNVRDELGGHAYQLTPSRSFLSASETN